MTSRAATPSLTDIALFAGLAAADKAAIAASCATLRVDRGDTLIREGIHEAALYFVIAGRFGVTREAQEHPLSEIGPGQPIGEIGFLTGAARSATVTALRDSVVLKLDRSAFDALAARHPQIWPALSEALARRLAETSAIARPTRQPLAPRTLAILPAGDAELDRAFVDRLIARLAATGRLIVARNAVEAGLDDEPDPDSIDQAQATQALTDLETRCDFLMLVAGNAPRAWAETAIRHADQVLMVAPFGADPEPGPMEAIARRFLAPEMHRLVLLHPSRRRLTGTRRWLEGRRLAMHHHVALDGSEDLDRLVRFLRGTARGLVCCGGGALCAAHIGVYEGLVEHGLQFDIMGGTSAGAAMTAGFVLGSAADEMERAVHDMFVAHRAMSRYTLPRYSLLDHVNFDRQLATFFGGIDIEDLWLPYFSVSTNLSRNTAMIHRQGDLFMAIRASASIPVMLPPVYTEDGEMLVDGCLLDNLPAGPLHALKRGPNVVVSLSLPELRKYDVDYAALPARTALVRAALMPFGRRSLPDAPNIVTVLMRSLMVGRQDFQRHLAPDDTLIVAPLPAGIGYLDWHRHSELRRIGYESACRAMAAGGATQTP